VPTSGEQAASILDTNSVKIIAAYFFMVNSRIFYNSGNESGTLGMRPP